MLGDGRGGRKPRGFDTDEMNDIGDFRISLNDEVRHSSAVKVSAGELRGRSQFRPDSRMSGRQIGCFNSRKQEACAFRELLDRHAVALVIILVPDISRRGTEESVPPKRPRKMHAE